MIPLHHDLWFTFRFAEDRIIPRFHLEAVLGAIPSHFCGTQMVVGDLLFR
jgi:hypothetical protein